MAVRGEGRDPAAGPAPHSSGLRLLIVPRPESLLKPPPIVPTHR